MKESLRIIGISVAVLVLTSSLFISNSTIAQDDNSPYDFDYENWERYDGVHPDSILPYNKDKEEWVWEPWYVHGSAVPFYQHEKYWTQEGWGMRMERIGYEGLSLHGGLYRQESVEPCRAYRFSIWTRAGINENHPTGNTSQMRVGIAIDGHTPSNLVMEPNRDALVWSDANTAKYSWEKLTVEAEAENSTITLYTRDYSSPENAPRFYWDEAEFSQIEIETLIDLDNPLPSETGGIDNIGEFTDSTGAWINWDVPFTNMSGQILYRIAPTSNSQPITDTHQIFLPLIAGAGQNWSYTSIVDASDKSFSIRITGLQPDTTYEYVIVSYGYFDDACQPLITDSSTPRQFTTDLD